MRTNIDIDDGLMAAAQEATGLPTKRAVVEEGLRTLVRLRDQQGIRALRGRVRFVEEPPEGGAPEGGEQAVRESTVGGHAVVRDPPRGDVREEFARTRNRIMRIQRRARLTKSEAEGATGGDDRDRRRR